MDGRVASVLNLPCSGGRSFMVMLLYSLSVSILDEEGGDLFDEK